MNMRKALASFAITFVLLVSLLAFCIPAKAGEVSMLVYGASFHQTHGHYDSRYNAFNPGIGVEYAFDNGVFGGASTYKDSYSKQAYTGYVGYRYYFGPVFLSLRAGYLNGSGFHQMVALPSIGYTYENFSVEFTTLPYDKKGTGTVSAIWFRWAFK